MEDGCHSCGGIVSRRHMYRAQTDNNIQVLNDGSLITFPTSFPLVLLLSRTLNICLLSFLSIYFLFPLFLFSTSSQTLLLLQSILSLPLARGKLSANAEFYFCNLHPLRQPSVPLPALQPWLLLQPDRHKSSRSL